MTCAKTSKESSCRVFGERVEVGRSSSSSRDENSLCSHDWKQTPVAMSKLRRGPRKELRRAEGGQSTHKRRETNTLISGACDNWHIVAWLERPPDEPNIPSARFATTSEFSAECEDTSRCGCRRCAPQTCQVRCSAQQCFGKPREWFLQGRSSQDEASRAQELKETPARRFGQARGARASASRAPHPFDCRLHCIQPLTRWRVTRRAPSPTKSLARMST